MKRLLYLVVILGGLFLTGCSNAEIPGSEPPEVFVKIGNEKFETKLGSYCWKGTCADTAGPIELLKEKEPVSVKPGERISFVMEYEPIPNEIHLDEFRNNGEKEIELNENTFTAPTTAGTYYYAYQTWWMNEKEANVSNGDAFYAFAIEVK